MSEQEIIALRESVARIDRVFQKFRELIDTDNSLSPSLRGALHMMIDDNLRVARARMLDYVVDHGTQRR